MLSRFRCQVGVVDPDRLEPCPMRTSFTSTSWRRHIIEQVGAVEDEAGRVRDLHALAVEGHVHHAEARERAGVGQLDLLGGGLAQLGVGAAERDSRPSARAPSPRIFRSAIPLRKRVVAPPAVYRTPCGRACGPSARLHALQLLGQVMSVISQAPGTRGRGSSPRARRPSGAAPACRWTSPRAGRRRPAGRNPTSAPSGCTSAPANGGLGGASASVRHPCPGRHGAARTDLDQLGEVVAGQQVVLGGWDEHCRRCL